MHKDAFERQRGFLLSLVQLHHSLKCWQTEINCTKSSSVGRRSESNTTVCIMLGATDETLYITTERPLPGM